jgi:hypothetical protein
VGQALRAARFFRVVTPWPPMMLGTFVVLGVASAGMVAIDPAHTPGVLRPVLVLQLFAASSGFAGAARRGYYDVLLTSGDRRAVMGLTHWLMSISPGVVTWWGIAGAEAAARRGFPEAALAGGTVVALTAVSCVAWAANVNLPRFSTAIAWLVLATAAASIWPPDAGFDGERSSWGVAAAAVANPAMLVGRALTPLDASIVGLLGLAVGSMAAALAWFSWADVPLESAQ